MSNSAIVSFGQPLDFAQVPSRHAHRGETAHAANVTFEAAFREEFAQRYQPLVRYLARLTGDAAAAADLAQETFVRLYGRGSMPDEPRAWLVSVAHNLLRNERQQTTRRLRLLDRHAAELKRDVLSESADASLEAAERRQRVRRALDMLPERERQMLLLRYDGFSYREIARALDIHEASVGTLLARAKNAFREALGADGPGTEAPSG